jgi:hypothetical protein
MALTAAYVSNEIVEACLAHLAWNPGTTLVTLASGTLSLTLASTCVQIFSGATAGQIVKMPDASTLVVDPSAGSPVATIGWGWDLWNDGTASVAVQDSAGTALFTLNPGQRGRIKNTTIVATGGWTWTIENKGDLKIKSGSVAIGSFAGNPKVATVTFTTAFPDANYSVSIQAGDARIVSYQSAIAASFVINLNANQAPTAAVKWVAIYNGEA